MIGDWTVVGPHDDLHTFTDDAKALRYALGHARADRPTHIESPSGERWLIVAEHSDIDVWAVRRLT